MNNKVLIIAGILALVVLGGLGYYFSTNLKQTSSPSTSTQATQTEKAPSAQRKQYTDAAGFSFSYPVDLELKKAGVTDNSTYADLTIASPETDGTLTIKVTDTTFATLEAWVKSNKEISAKTKETTLGTLKAVEISLDTKTTLAAIDQGVLFLLTTTSSKDPQYWQNVYNTAKASFAFSAPQASTDTSGQAMDSGVDLEGEEVIE